MIQNGIPVASLVVETVVAVIISQVTLTTIRRFQRRKRRTTLLLSLSFVFYTFAVASSVAGKYMNYFSSVSYEVIDYSAFSINLAYCLVAFANILIYGFVEMVFLSNKEWRLYAYATLSSINIGLILGNNSTSEGGYSQVFPYVVIMVLISSFLYILLSVLAFKEVRKTDDAKVKIGMIFIGLFGLLLQLMFVLFIADLVIIQINDTSYNLPYYLAWISAALACICGYLGYINPTWFRQLLGVEQP